MISDFGHTEIPHPTSEIEILRGAIDNFKDKFNQSPSSMVMLNLPFLLGFEPELSV